MPLTPCADCGNQHSDVAFLCPHCGRPATASMLRKYTQQNAAAAAPDSRASALSLYVAWLSQVSGLVPKSIA